MTTALNPITVDSEGVATPRVITEAHLHSVSIDTGPDPDVVALDDVAAGWWGVYINAETIRNQAEEKMARARQKIEDALGDKAVGTIAGQPVVTYRTSFARRFDQKLAKAKLMPADFDACFVSTPSRRFVPVRAEA